MYFVYLIKAGKRKGVAVKIGIAGDVHKRLAELQTGNPYELRCVGTIPFDNKEQAYEMEQFLHHVYANRRLQGEWFAINDFSLMEAQKVWEARNPKVPWEHTEVYKQIPNDNYKPQNPVLYNRIIQEIAQLQQESRADFNNIIKKIDWWKEQLTFERRRDKKSFQGNQLKRFTKRWNLVEDKD